MTARLFTLLLAFVLAAPFAAADQYLFSCKNLFMVQKNVKVMANSVDEARFKLRNDKEFDGWQQCRYQSVITDEQLKAMETQDTWGKKIKRKFKETLDKVPTTTDHHY